MFGFLRRKKEEADLEATIKSYELEIVRQAYQIDLLKKEKQAHNAATEAEARCFAYYDEMRRGEHGCLFAKHKDFHDLFQLFRYVANVAAEKNKEAVKMQAELNNLRLKQMRER